LHLLAWDQDASTADNLRRLALTPGGVLLDDAAGILREELPESGGYARVLAAIGRGATRFSEIASEANQRIDHVLDVLVEAGFVRKALPVGSPRGARPGYEIADPYISFWFSLLYQNTLLIDSGQGEAVLHRTEPLWQRHLGAVFEELARSHARRLVATGALPRDLIVGRWWTTRGPQCEVDVLGVRGSHTALLGEARWQARPVGLGALEQLRRKVVYTSSPLDEPIYVLWGRQGVDDAVKASGALGFGLQEMLE
jgi:AAA+ ATPase superfamily predicted ATPase